jgi:hypothetical protein
MDSIRALITYEAVEIFMVLLAQSRDLGHRNQHCGRVFKFINGDEVALNEHGFASECDFSNTSAIP